MNSSIVSGSDQSSSEGGEVDGNSPSNFVKFSGIQKHDAGRGYEPRAQNNSNSNKIMRHGNNNNSSSSGSATNSDAQPASSSSQVVTRMEGDKNNRGAPSSSPSSSNKNVGTSSNSDAEEQADNVFGVGFFASRWGSLQ